MIVYIADHYDDVVDSSSAVATRTPHGMHVYFLTESRRPSAERLIEFMRQTNDPEYITSFVLDPDRGFRDKVYETYEYGNPLESSDMHGSHVSFARNYTTHNLIDQDTNDELFFLLELRKRVAEYAYHAYRDVNFTKLKGSLFVDVLTNPWVTPLDIYNNWARFIEGYMYNLANVVCNLRHTHGMENAESVGRDSIQMCKEERREFRIIDDGNEDVTAIFRLTMQRVMLGIEPPERAAIHFVNRLLDFDEMRTTVREVHEQEALSRT
eukprot:2323809-Pleurochrysis_carterae.AAC.1